MSPEKRSLAHRLRQLLRDLAVAEGTDRWNAAAFALFLAFVAIGPSLHGLASSAAREAMGGGTVQPAGNALLKILAFAIAAVTVLSKSRILSLRPLAIPLTATMGIALLGIVQLVPLPDGVLERLAPVNLKIYHETRALLALFHAAPTVAPKISIAPAETAGAVTLILAYAALFIAAASLLRSRIRRRVFTSVLLGGTFVHIIIAALRESGADRVHGVFVNPNHFAAYLEIALAVAFGALWGEVLLNPDRVPAYGDPGDRFEKQFLPTAGRVLVWAVIAVGIGLAKSRGALLASAIATAVLLVMGVRHRRARLQRRMAVGITVAVLAGLTFAATTVGMNPFLRFFQSDPRELGMDTRVVLWKHSIAAWRQFPLLGSGLGTFREAFRRVQPRELPGMVEHAHSDPLQLLVTGGSVGAVLGIVLFGSLFALLFSAWRRQKHREESAFVLGGFGALLSLMLHGLVEFNFSIPVIPATLACVLGAAWAAGRDR